MIEKAWRQILRLLWLVLLVAAAIVPPSTFAYDAHRQVLIAYDGLGAACFVGCDAACVSAKHEMQTGTTGARGLFAKFTAFLATEGATTAEDLAAAANRAAQTVGPGSGPVYGTQVHSAFQAEVEALGQTGLQTEVSYLNGAEVPYGTPGSVRIDVGQYGANGQIQAVFDLKTGNATLTPARIQQIQQAVGSQVPVTIIRP